MTLLPILTVIGYSNAGKTRCVVGLIASLSRRGYHIASAKHCHQGFNLDVRGKDSWHHKEAGAVMTIMSGKNRIGIVSDAEPLVPLQQLADRYIHDADLLLAEGYSWEPYPKILILSKESLEQERPHAPDLLFALVGEKPMASSLPQFTFEELDRLALLIERRYLHASSEGVA